LDNNRFVVFRDVLTVDKSTFPLALRVSMQPRPVAAAAAAATAAAATKPANGEFYYQSSASLRQSQGGDNPGFLMRGLDVSEDLVYLLRLYRKEVRGVGSWGND